MIGKEVSAMKALEFIEKYVKCPLCSSGNLEKDFVFDLPEQRLTWEKCKKCGIVFQNPRLTQDSVSDLYESTAYFGNSNVNSLSGYVHFQKNDRARIEQSRKRLSKIIESTGVKKGKLLDVGSASGFFGAAAKEHGFDVTCLEPDTALAQFGREVYGLNFLNSSLDACELPKEEYDLITIWGTDSHFLHPLYSFEKLIVSLKPGGVFAMSYQHFDRWIRYIFPKLKVSWNVMYNFTDESFDLLLSKTGLTLKSRSLEWQTVSVDHLLRVVRFPSIPKTETLNVRVPSISFRFIIATKKIL